MDLVAVDWFKDTKRMDHVARRQGCAAQVTILFFLFKKIKHIANKDLFIEHVSSSDKLADVLTKPLSFDHFAYMQTKVNVCP